jgi:hypothetical protein
MAREDASSYRLGPRLRRAPQIEWIFDDLAVQVVEVVHMAASLGHQDALNQLASSATVPLADGGRHAELP